MVTFTYETRPGELKTVHLDPEECNYNVEHDHWIIEVDTPELDAMRAARRSDEEAPPDDGRTVAWIPRERVFEVAGDAGAFRDAE